MTFLEESQHELMILLAKTQLNQEQKNHHRVLVSELHFEGWNLKHLLCFSAVNKVNSLVIFMEKTAH